MPMGPPDTADRRAQAIALVSAGTSFREAAKALGVDRKTVRRWTMGPDGHVPMGPARPEVQAAAESVVAARVEALSTLAECQRKAAANLARAMQVLIDQLEHPDPREARAAALAILDRGGMVAGSAVRVEVAHNPTPTEVAVELLALPGPVADNREAVSK